jgi:hypothetical protein
VYKKYRNVLPSIKVTFVSLHEHIIVKNRNIRYFILIIIIFDFIRIQAAHSASQFYHMKVGLFYI